MTKTSAIYSFTSCNLIQMKEEPDQLTLASDKLLHASNLLGRFTEMTVWDAPAQSVQPQALEDIRTNPHEAETDGKPIGLPFPLDHIARLKLSEHVIWENKNLPGVTPKNTMIHHVFGPLKLDVFDNDELRAFLRKFDETLTALGIRPT